MEGIGDFVDAVVSLVPLGRQGGGVGVQPGGGRVCLAV